MKVFDQMNPFIGTKSAFCKLLSVDKNLYTSGHRIKEAFVMSLGYSLVNFFEQTHGFINIEY